MGISGYRWITGCVLLSQLLFGSAAVADQIRPVGSSSIHPNKYELRLFSVLKDIQAGQVTQARQELESILRVNPQFKLAQLVHADLLRARYSVLGSIGAVGQPVSDHQQALRDEMFKRWQHLSHHERAGIPGYLLDLDTAYKHVIVVDTSASRLYVYQNDNGQLNLKSDYYISIGQAGADKSSEGDKRTPIGVYFVNDFIPSDKLPDLYGAGAFPINYPNEWDQHLGKTGNGIWLHGTPSYTFNRPPQASDGCVTLSNYDFNHLSSFVDVGNTPVIIADGIEWADRKSIDLQREIFYSLLEQWREDWESHNIDRFLSNYSSDFDSQGKDFNAWAENARVAYADAGKIQIRLSNVSVFAYPHQKLLVTTFHQEYRSENTRLDMFKRQYWKQDDQGRWKIVYEGSV